VPPLERHHRSGPAFALWVGVFGNEPVRQFGHRRRPAFGGFLPCRIVPVRHRIVADRFAVVQNNRVESFGFMAGGVFKKT